MDFTLRKWEITDAQSLAAYANNFKIALNLRDAFPHPYTLCNAQSFIESCIASDESCKCLRAIDVDGQAVGSIGIFKKDDVYRLSAELGYWLGEPFWGRGIITAAVVRMCQDIFSRWDIVRIFAEPFAQNAGSRRVLEKAGFKLEGILEKSVCKKGVLQDSCIYALLR